MPPNPPAKTYFPLRWESTGDKWWYASPIDWAAANGHYDVVRELLRLDANHLISLTSLRRLRRLESVWDDAGDAHFADAAKNRSSVARRLLQDSDKSTAKGNPLIGAGYGGWLLYTAASAADLGFVKELLDRAPLLVFGEGEYGLTDILYAAARSKSPEVFWILYDFAVSPRFERNVRDGVAGEVPRGFKWEVVNRAVHAAARGGNLGVLVDLLGGGDGDGVLAYRDAYGSTVLQAAAGRGQVEVVKHLIESYGDIVSSVDNEGNTALHMAAYKGHFSVVEALLDASPSSVSATNKSGNTLLHMTVAGALSPGFRRVDRQVELMKRLMTARNSSWNIEHIINVKNNEGRTALHMAIIGSVHSKLVEHLMAGSCINVNIKDDHGMTPLDHLREQPRSLSSEMLIRQLISAGGMSNCQDYSARKAIASHLRTQSAMCTSPGTSFRVLDSEIFEYSGVEHVSSGSTHDRRRGKIRHLSSPSVISLCRLNAGDEEQIADKGKKHGGTVQNAAKRLKNALHWPKMKKKKGMDDENDDNVTYAESHRKSISFDETPIPLRERFSVSSVSLANNKRTLAVRSNISSPTNKKKIAFDSVQDGMLDLPHVNVPAGRLSSSSASLCKTSVSSRRSLDKEKWGDDATGLPLQAQDGTDEAPRLIHKEGSANKRLLMNQYLCFGGPSLSTKSPFGSHQRQPSNGNKPPIQTVACN